MRGRQGVSSLRAFWLAPAALAALALLAATGCDEMLDDDSDLLVEDLGTWSVPEDGEAYFDLVVPEGAVSTTVVMEGSGGDLLTQWTVLDPDGNEIYSYGGEPTDYAMRVFPTDDTHTFLHATSPAEPLRAGTYQLEPYVDTTGSTDLTVTAIHKLALGSGNLSLDVTFHMVGLDGLDAASAPDHELFQECINELDAILSGGGILISDIAYEDVTSSVDDLKVIESDAGPSSELGRLLAMSGSGTERRLHLFMVEGINYGGMETLGQAGSAPGPALVQGTSHSGIAVSTIDLETAPAVTAQVIGHEIGHYLGLFHTVEKDGASWDPLADTTTCGIENDGDGDGLLSAEECAGKGADNLMFWSPPPGADSLTGDQEYVIVRSPLPY